MKAHSAFCRAAARLFRQSLLAAIPIASVVGMTAVAYAAVEHFASGEALSTAKMNANFDSLQARLDALEARGVVMKNGKSYARDATYCGSTVGATGQLAGYAGAKGFCEAACGGYASAHMCTGDELVRSRQMGIVVLPASGGWFSAGSYAIYSASPVRDCLGWTSSASTEYGQTWDQSGPSGIAVCSTSLPAMCCN